MFKLKERGSDQLEAVARAEATARCLLRTAPAAVPGIVFLSGGQSPELASARLNALNRKFPAGPPLGALVLVRSRHPTAGTRDLARRQGAGCNPLSRCSPTGAAATALRGNYAEAMEAEGRRESRGEKTHHLDSIALVHFLESR